MKKIRLILILLAIVLLWQQNVLPGEADELFLDRLVEKRVITKKEAAEIKAASAMKKQEELKAKKKFNVEGKTKVDLSGFLQIEYVADETKGRVDTFRIRRAGIDFRGDVSKKIGWRLQIDAVGFRLEEQAHPVRLLPFLLDASLDYKPHSFANFRIGQFSVPFGQESLQSSAKLDTINRSQVTEELAPGRDNKAIGRDIGVRISGEFDFQTKRKILEYAVGVFNGAGINLRDDNEYKDIAGRVLIFPIQGLSVGVSHYDGKSGVTGTGRIRTGGEISYIISGISLKGEYITGKDGTIERDGWYIQTGYKIMPELETVLKYDSYDRNKHEPKDRTDVATLGLNWFVNKWTKIQVNYEWKIEEEAQVNNNVFLTQFQVQF